MAARHTSYEPLPRAGHAAVAVDNKLHMWGGEGGSVEKSQELAHNLEVFDISMEHGSRNRPVAPHHLDCVTLHTQWWGHVCSCLEGMVVCPITTVSSSLTYTPFSGSG